MRKNKRTHQSPEKILNQARRGFYFTTEEKTPDIDKISEEIQEKLNKARIKELQSKHITRIFLTALFMFLLFAQNGFVCYLVYKGFVTNQLQSLALVFTTFITATLTETYFVIKIIVNYIFKDDDYSYKKTS